MIKKLLAFSGVEAVARALSWSFPMVLAFIVSVEQYGAIGVFLASEALLLPLILGGFDRFILRFGSGRSDYVENVVLIWGMIFSLGFVLLLVVITLRKLWPGMPEPLLLYISGVALVLSILAQSITRVNAAVARVNADSIDYARHRLPFVILRWVVGVPYIYLVDSSYSGFLYAMVYVSLATLVVSGILSRKYFSLHNKLQLGSLKDVFMNVVLARGKRIISFSAPYIPHSIAGSALAFSDRIMIEMFSGVEQVGNYQVSYSIGSAIVFMYAIIAVYMEPRLYKKSNSPHKDDAILIAYQKVLFLMGSMGGLVIIALVSHYESLFFDRGYRDTSRLVIILLLSHLYHAIYLAGNYRLARELRTSFIAISTMGAALINILLNLLLIPRYGALGAAWATLVSYSLLSVIISSFSLKVLAGKGFGRSAFNIWIGLLLFGVIVLTSNYSSIILMLIITVWSVVMAFPVLYRFCLVHVRQ